MCVFNFIFAKLLINKLLILSFERNQLAIISYQNQAVHKPQPAILFASLIRPQSSCPWTAGF